MDYITLIQVRNEETCRDCFVKCHAENTSTPIKCSWWPSPITWKNSGMNIGRWTVYCEQWYRKRRGLFEAGRFGEAKLHSMDQWKATLRLSEKLTKGLINSLDSSSAEFIAGNVI